jgi:hypothetical protein
VNILYGLVWVLVLHLATHAEVSAIDGDINRDGTVDFADFLIFAGNFGESGPVGGQDTVFITIRDTIVLSTSGIEIPTPPQTGLETDVFVDRGTLFVDDFIFSQVFGEIVNNTAESIQDVTVRLTIRDESSRVLGVERFQSLPSIPILVPGGRRPFYFLDVAGVSTLQDLEHSTFEFVWEEGREGIGLSNDLVLLLDRVSIGDTIAGEILNVGMGDAESVRILFSARNGSGQVIDIELGAANFGDPIPPGGTGVFETVSSFPSAAVEYYYYITWGPFSNKSETPYTRLEVQ